MTDYPDHLACDSVGTAQGTVCLWLKRPGREAFGRIRSGAHVKKRAEFISLSSALFRALCLFESRDSVFLTRFHVPEGREREKSRRREVSEQKAILALEGNVAECAKL